MRAVINAETGEVVFAESEVESIDTTQLARGMRDVRNDMLTQSDVYVLPDRWAVMTPEQQAAWSAYRQGLRDVPLQAGFPSDIVWPVKP